MIKPNRPRNERERLQALKSYEILDSDLEPGFDDLTRIAASICSVPIALVSLVDGERQWFKSKVGLTVCETSRDVSFCGHAILQPETMLIVEDAHADPRFFDNPLVTGEPHVRFYAGTPLVDPHGFALGTLCVIDRQPRVLDPAQREGLHALARQVVGQMLFRKSNALLRLMRDQLKNANQELQEFTSIAAHDLQEPVRKLVTFSELLKDDLGPDLPERASEDITFIQDAGQRMQTLIQDLLQLSRAGSGELKQERVSLAECVARALDALSLRIEETHARIEIAELPFVRGDATLLTQLFQNLIGNALKFTGDEHPHIGVTCQREGDNVVIGVQDNGIGIDPENSRRIFSPFKRLHGRSRYGGSGIGLAIVRKAVERHGGRVWVESQTGQGSHFKFTLEAIEDITPATPVPAPA